MDQLIDEHLERMAELARADRRNGCYRRGLLTEVGMIELHAPRTRTFSALAMGAVSGRSDPARADGELGAPRGRKSIQRRWNARVCAAGGVYRSIASS
jgi:hypothetical protein